MDEERGVEKIAGEKRDAEDNLAIDSETRTKAQIECLFFFFAIWVVPCLAVCCKLKEMKENDVRYCSRDICCCYKDEDNHWRCRKFILEEDL